MKKQEYICEVTFFRNQRQKIPYLKGGYRPHFIVKGTREYLGIQFCDGEVSDFEKNTLAAAFNLYDGVDYSPLIVGVEFWIMEGGNCVGEGLLLDIDEYHD